MNNALGKANLISIIIIINSFTVFAQFSVIDKTNVHTLTQLASKWSDEYRKNKEIAIQEALKRDMPLRQELEDGRVMELQGITERGVFLYKSTGNLDAARTISTDKVWPGGSIGTSLSGDSMVVGEWDGGAVRLTHQELVQRVTQVDNASSVINHATHVGGTMIASGVDNLAKGMAFTARLDAYDWNNDNAEMATAASNGLLLSNHSYVNIAGWYNNSGASRWEWWGDTTLSGTADYTFGFYESTCQNWDQTAHNAPYYLIVKAAGNNRGSNHVGHHYLPQHGTWSSAMRLPDGGTSGYDCIPTYGVAKNILTVGAVGAIPGGYSGPSSVVMSSFSSWGPADDGRIKPDIVANGVGVYSCLGSSNTAYASWNGTSMATPTVTGSLALIQQHYKNENGVLMKAATLKALAIHTADEAGSSPGPDYKFGWGLLNTARAVGHISDTSNTKDIIEANLENGQVFSFEITATGSSSIRASICWTDIPGTPVAPALNPTALMLVNDLDIRIRRNSDSTMFYPYILNPSAPAGAAITGDNFRDNVEQIYLALPMSGTYTVSISHKGTLVGGSQDFSLILDGGKVQPQQPNCAYTVNSFPDEQDFEIFQNCSGTSGVPCQLVPANTGWYNDTLDDTDWKIYSGTSPSSLTGPTVDYTEGTSTGKYAYIEASTSGTGFPYKKAILYPPCYNLGSLVNTELFFAYHMYGSTMGTLTIEKYNGFLWTPIWSKSGDQGNTWHTEVVDLSAYDGDTIKLRIVGVTGNNYWSDMAIDGIEVREYDSCRGLYPTVTLTQVGPSGICQGDTSLLTAGGGIAYQWLKDGQVLAGDTTAFLNVVSQGNYNVRVIDSSSCYDTASTGAYIAVYDLPLVFLNAGGSATFCDGGQVVLSTLNGVAWQWYKNGKQLSSANTINYTATQTGKYNVVVTDSNQCSDSAHVAFPVTVNPLPNVSFDSVMDLCDISPPLYLTEGLPAGLTGVYSGPGVTGGAGVYYFDPSVAGAGIHTLWYTYEDSNLCKNTASRDALVKACVGIDENDGMSQIRLIPNPGKYWVKIDIENDMLGLVELKILNVSGQQVYLQSAEKKSGIEIVNLNLSALPKGLYFVHLQMSRLNWTQKLILE